MDDDVIEGFLSETEIDVCSIDVEDLEVNEAIGVTQEFGDRKTEVLNDERKDSCSSPDADSGIDEKVTTSEQTPNGAASLKGTQRGRVIEGESAKAVLENFLTDHDYPVKRNDINSVDDMERSSKPQQSSLESTVVDRICTLGYNSEKRSSFTGFIEATTVTEETSEKVNTPLNLAGNERSGQRELKIEAEETLANEKRRMHNLEETQNEVRRMNRKRKQTLEGLDQDMDMDLNQGSGDDDSDQDPESSSNPDPLNRFYFESDHLALKHSRDYQRLLKTLVILEAQRTQAIKDLEELEKWKDKAIENPIEFVEKVNSRDGLVFPKRQAVTKLPSIEWGRHLAHCTGAKIQDMYVGTRGSLNKTSKGSINRANHDVQPGIGDSLNEDFLDSEVSSTKLVRGRPFHESKPATFNQLWTTEEQEKLEKLLHVYPPEDVESRRWEKIARALGNRTPKQVASRVQKYFIKLAKAGLPVPGRVPAIQRKNKMNPISFRNSTFFPSWRPAVNMPDDEDESLADSMDYDISESISCASDAISDDDDIPTHLQDTEEYREYSRLVKLKKEREYEISKGISTIHNGFHCDKCGVEPIVGTRWHCLDCSYKDLDLCNNCVGRSVETKGHVPEHNLKAVQHPDSTFIDGDYLKLSQHKGSYNYLDPNFGPLNSMK